MRTFSSKPVLLVATLLATTINAQGKCDHYLDDECVDAYGDTSFEFKPLFREPPRFGYGFRVRFESENDLSSGPVGYSGDENELRAWFQYDNATINRQPDANRATRMAVTFTNSSGSVSGGNNGCDGVLGEKCAANLKDILKWSMVHADDYSAWGNIGTFQDNPLTNLSCPESIFEEFRILPRFTDFISEYNETFKGSLTYRDDPYDSGNATRPWYSDMGYRSAEEQMTYTAVGFVTRYPPTKPRKYDDIQLELVCVRPKAVEGSGERIDVSAIPKGDGDSGSEGDDDDSSTASRSSWSSPLVAWGSMVATVGFLLL